MAPINRPVPRKFMFNGVAYKAKRVDSEGNCDGCVFHESGMSQYCFLNKNADSPVPACWPPERPDRWDVIWVRDPSDELILPEKGGA